MVVIEADEMHSWWPSLTPNTRRDCFRCPCTRPERWLHIGFGKGCHDSFPKWRPIKFPLRDVFPEVDRIAWPMCPQPLSVSCPEGDVRQSARSQALKHLVLWKRLNSRRTRLDAEVQASAVPTGLPTHSLWLWASFHEKAAIPANRSATCISTCSLEDACLTVGAGLCVVALTGNSA